MNSLGYLIVIVLMVTAVYFGIRWLVRYSRYRGTKIVTCPETRRPTMVEVDALHASLTSTVGPPDIRLQDCTRWPTQEKCGQECLVHLDVGSDQCLVSGVLMRWYRGRNCFYCSKPMNELHWADHKPALLSPEDLLVRWSGVSLENLSTVLNTHLPVCWDCYIVQSFRREHPDLVVYRPGLNDVTEAQTTRRHHSSLIG
jgi:hypothetical protein